MTLTSFHINVVGIEMTLSLVENIELIKRKISTFTGANVTLGMPDGSEPGLYLFPYSYLIDHTFRNNPMVGTAPQTTQPYLVKCLLIPGSFADYVALNKGLDFIYTNPLLETNKELVKVVIEDISTELLTSLFISVGATYRLSIAFEMHCSVR